MSELTLLLLRLLFLAVMWAFVFAIVYALRSDLFGQKARRMPVPAAAAAPRPAPAAPASHPTAPKPAVARTPVGSSTPPASSSRRARRRASRSTSPRSS